MLRDLYVQNLAVIAEATVEFGPGLNVLTGETGAGKSIVVDSLALLSGARASSDLIRSDAAVLSVTGVFQPSDRQWQGHLSEAGIEPRGEEIVVRREISREGRNRVFLDDQPVTLALLGKVAPSLIRIHTQREELGLITPDLQRAWLDRSAGNEAEALLERVQEAFDEYRRLAARLARAQGDERLRRERIDLLEFQGSEIDTARLLPAEDEELRQERESLRHSESIAAALGESYDLLFEGEGAAVDRISQVVRKLQQIADWESRGTAWVRDLEATAATLQETSRELRERLESIAADPVRLDAVEERLAVIERLCRKYGQTAARVLEYRQQIGRELEELRGDAEQRDRLTQRVEEALLDYRSVAMELSRRRAEWGVGFTDRVHRELKDLAMGKARFAIDLGTRSREVSPLRVNDMAVEFGATGFDQVSYLLAANPGEEMAPLARSASGGELSRIYLAVQLASRAAGAAASPSLIFDEVDAGIGGAQAAALGRKLKRLAEGGQILTVTHLPQVASHADHHFKVDKRVTRGRTRTSVVRLDDDGRVEEVARMLTGKKITPLSISHAREMIAGSAKGSG